MSEPAAPVRVRFAPSPTGYLHVGGARTALFNWLFARRHGGTFVLRVEDTDTARERPEYREEIFRALRWLGLDEDEGPAKGGPYGPYTQRERLDRYAAAAEQLLAAGAVYPCFCPSRADEPTVAGDDEPEESGKKAPRCMCGFLAAEEVAARTAALGTTPALRMRIDPAATQRVSDLIRGEVEFPPGEVEDFLIVKAGGAPLYNFAAVVDDAAMRITHVIRGEEHLANTPKQIALYRALGYPIPKFAHLPILLNTERKKLSKRDGATAVYDYRRLGYLPEALVNFLALLGWSPGGDRELMSLDEMIALFDLDRVQKHAAIFDTVKLTWMNGEYLRRAPLDRLVDAVIEYLRNDPEAGTLRLDRAHVAAVCTLMQERAKTIADIAEAGRYFFTPATELAWDRAAIEKRAGTPQALGALQAAREALAEAAAQPGFVWERGAIETVIRGLAEREGRKAAEYIAPLRVATTGFAVSPGIFELLEVLGREVSLARIDAFLNAQRREALR